MNAPLKSNLLRLICTQSVISNEVITFVVGGTQYRVDESVVRTALNFPADNLVGLPTDQELVSFFQDINYQGPVDLTRLSKSLLVDEWSSFFDTLIKVFANCTKTSFSNIPSLLQYIGFDVAYNRRINFAQLTWHAMVRRIIAAKRDYGLGNKVSCYYPRFLSVILHHVLSPEHMTLFKQQPFRGGPDHNKEIFHQVGHLIEIYQRSCCCYSLLIQFHTTPRHSNTTTCPSTSSGSIHSRRSFSSRTGNYSYLCCCYKC